MLIEAKNLT